VPETVFISGISGFLGQALARRLLKGEFRISGLARRPFALERCQAIFADIRSPESYFAETSQAEIVIHLAAPTLAREIADRPLECLQVTVSGTLNLLEAFQAGAGEHFLFFSSGKVYGRSAPPPFTEAEELRPKTVLGRAKKVAEDLVRFFAEHSHKRFTIVRLFNAYGPGQRPGFLIPSILEQVDKDSITLGDITCRRDFIYVDDVTDAICLLISGGSTREPGGAAPTGQLDVFNIGSGVSWSPAEIVSTLAAVIGKQLLVRVDPSRQRTGEAAEEVADVSRLKALGWKPRVDLETGLGLTWKEWIDGARSERSIV